MSLRPGISAEIRLTVTDSDTALSVGSGDVPALGTPRLLALMEEATVAAISLDEGMTSVGTTVTLTHDAPTPVGAEIVVTAELMEIDGRRLTFEVTARDGETIAGAARIERIIVDRARFLARLQGRDTARGGI